MIANISTIKKAWKLLDSSEKSDALYVLGIGAASALSSAIMVASVMPFLAVLADPTRIYTNPVLQWFYTFLNFNSDYNFLISLGGISFAVIIFAGLFQGVKAWITVRFSAMCIHSIGYRLLETYYTQPYTFFLSRHSDGMSARILSETGNVVNCFFRPVSELIAACLTIFAVIIFLLWINPVFTLISLTLLGGIYGLIYMGSRNLLSKVGKVLVDANVQRFRIINEIFEGVKELKISKQNNTIIKNYSVPSLAMARAQIIIAVLSQVPQIALQALALGGIIMLCITLLDPTVGQEAIQLSDLLPTIGVFALAGQRLMPELSKIYQSLNLMKAGVAAIDAVFDDMITLRRFANTQNDIRDIITFKKEICLSEVHYSYPLSNLKSLMGVTITVKYGEKIGIVGSTGSGKTTLADLLLGLLQPDHGKMMVDGELINSINCQSWMQRVGYVPQNIFLKDASVLENIALTSSEAEIDVQRVYECAKIAQIDQYIRSSLPEGYQTYIGERGVRLSGGQRQRLGIARALYNGADLIIFDEATSALDTLTEAEVMGAIDALPDDKTVIMIAHRLSTVRKSDRIIVLERGQVAGFGSWEDLKKNNVVFQRLIDA